MHTLGHLRSHELDSILHMLPTPIAHIDVYFREVDVLGIDSGGDNAHHDAGLSGRVVLKQSRVSGLQTHHSMSSVSLLRSWACIQDVGIKYSCILLKHTVALMSREIQWLSLLHSPLQQSTWLVCITSMVVHR